MTSLVLALLMSQAYSAPVVTTLWGDITFSHEATEDAFTGIISWDQTSSEGKYVAITIGFGGFVTGTKDIIVCASYNPGNGEVLKVIDAKYDDQNSKIVEDGAGKENIGASPTAVRSGDVVTCTFERKFKTLDDGDFEIISGTSFKMAFADGTTSGAVNVFSNAITKGNTKDITIVKKVADTTVDKNTNSTTKAESLGSLPLLGKLSLAVAAGVILN